MKLRCYGECKNADDSIEAVNMSAIKGEILCKESGEYIPFGSDCRCPWDNGPKRSLKEGETARACTTECEYTDQERGAYAPDWDEGRKHVHCNRLGRGFRVDGKCWLNLPAAGEEA